MADKKEVRCPHYFFKIEQHVPRIEYDASEQSHVALAASVCI